MQCAHIKHYMYALVEYVFVVILLCSFQFNSNTAVNTGRPESDSFLYSFKNKTHHESQLFVYINCFHYFILDFCLCILIGLTFFDLLCLSRHII